jgi:hypothetical protein
LQALVEQPDVVGWQSVAVLLDHPIRAHKDRWRDREAERLGGFHVDHQLELRRQLYRQIGGLGPFKDLVDEIRQSPEGIGQVGP